MKLSLRDPRRTAVLAVIAAAAAAVACADATVANQGPEQPGATLDGGGGNEASTFPSTQDDGGAEGDASGLRDGGEDAPKSLCTVHGWCHTEVDPEETLRAVWGDGSGTVWTVSEQGKIFRWDGAKWSTVYTDTGGLFTIWGSGPTDIWVGGTNGLFHGTGATSATLSWMKFAVDGNVPVLSVWGSAANDVWAVGNDGTKSRVLHYAGPPADPMASGWTVDPVTASVVGKLVKVWGNSPTDVWTVGSTTGDDWGQDVPLIWHRSSDGAGVPTFKQDTSFDYFFSSVVKGGYTVDPNNLLWYGTNYGSPYMLWGRRADSSQPYEWTDAFNWKIPLPWSCASEVHNGILAFAQNDVWTFGNFGRLCHFDGTRWDLAAVSIENVPLENVFWDAWAPNGDASQMWVVGQGVAIRKQPTSNP
jgi:hypothetical protein